MRGRIAKSSQPHNARHFHSGDRTMIKDILAVLSSNQKNTVAQDYAASIASSFDAHIAGAAIVHNLVIPGTIFDGAAAGLMADFRQKSEAAAQSAIGRFEERC